MCLKHTMHISVANRPRWRSKAHEESLKSHCKREYNLSSRISSKKDATQTYRIPGDIRPQFVSDDIKSSRYSHSAKGTPNYSQVFITATSDLTLYEIKSNIESCRVKEQVKSSQPHSQQQDSITKICNARGPQCNRHITSSNSVRQPTTEHPQPWNCRRKA